MEKTGSPLDKPTAVVEGAADGLADGLEEEPIAAHVHAASHRAGEAFAAHPSPRSERLRARLDRIERKVDSAVEKTRVRARGVAETARRARHAPPVVLGDLKKAAKAWKDGVAASLGLMAAAGALGLIAVVVFTVALVQGLNQIWGAPAGTFAVAALYGILAAVFFASAKGKAAKGREEARGHLEDAKEELRSVTRPAKAAFQTPAPLEATRIPSQPAQAEAPLLDPLEERRA